MGHNNSFEKVMYFTKCCVYLVCTWPPPRTATKWEIIKCDVAWLISFASGLCLCIPIAFSIYVYRHDTLIVTQSVGFFGATLNLLIKTFVFRMHRNQTQTLIAEMESFLENMRPHERIILQLYVDRFAPFHTFASGVNYMATFVMAFAPLVLHDQPFPTYAVYPFNVDFGILMYVVYIHQTISGLQCASGVTADCQAALIMWFAGARFEILAEELGDVTEPNEFEDFVRKHKKLLSFAFKISDTMRYIAFASTMTCGVVAIMGAIKLVGNEPLAVRLKFGIATMVGTLNVLICAWPADNLINACNTLANAVYSTSWIDMSPKMMKNMLMVLRRCQRPIIVSIGGFLPTLSLQSYASFLSGLFSYFTTLRVAMVSEN